MKRNRIKPEKGMVAANVLSSIENVLNFHVKKDQRCIVRCLDLLINTIHVIVSEHLLTIDDGISYEEKEHVLAQHYAREIEIELTFIEMLRKNASGNELMAFINDHLILISQYENSCPNPNL